MPIVYIHVSRHSKGAVALPGACSPVWYTDGSKSEEGRVGAGLYDGVDIYEKRVGDWNTVYEAEIEAIKEAIRRCPKSGACILMDSMSAFKALEKAIRCGEVEDCNMRRVMVAAEDKLKAHIGIRGNEIADVAAKGGSKRDLVGDE